MDKKPEGRFPIGATVNRRTGEVDLQHQLGDDEAFAAVLLPLLRVGRMVLKHEEDNRGKENPDCGVSL